MNHTRPQKKSKPNLPKRGVQLKEGRYLSLYISAKLAAVTEQKAQNILYGGLNRQYYKDLIIKLIQQHGPVSREEINLLLVDKLPEALSSRQKYGMVHNLLTDLRSKRAIRNAGTKRAPKWVMNDFKEDNKQ